MLFDNAFFIIGSLDLLFLTEFKIIRSSRLTTWSDDPSKAYCFDSFQKADQLKEKLIYHPNLMVLRAQPLPDGSLNLRARVSSLPWV